jgi:Na+-transporting methylmalonyl-CoA/oxaloacetate decarboxylase gamma subunit
VHGLLFAGVASVTTSLGGAYGEALEGTRIAGGALLVVAGLAFVGSVLSLVKAVRPYEASEFVGSTTRRVADAFFPTEPTKDRSFDVAFDDQLRCLQKLASEDDFRREYAYEQVKLGALRRIQADAAKRGFRLLRVELFAVLLFLTLVALVEVGAFGLTG